MDPKDHALSPRAEAEVLSDRGTRAIDRALEVFRDRNPAQGDFGFDTLTHAFPTFVEAVDSGISAHPAPLPDDEPAADRADALETTDDPRIPPDQSYFKIGEVAKIVGVKPYVLRYWESEFPAIRPVKTSSKQRRYRRKDVALLLTIRRLRHDEQLTIAQTKQLIQEMKKGRKPAEVVELPLQIPKPATVESLDPARLHRRLAEMRQAVLELLHAVEE